MVSILALMLQITFCVSCHIYVRFDDLDLCEDANIIIESRKPKDMS